MPESFAFVKKYDLKTMMYVGRHRSYPLSSNTFVISRSTEGPVRDSLRDFATSSGISLIECDIGYNQEPFVHMNVDALRKVISTALGTYALYYSKINDYYCAN